MEKMRGMTDMALSPAEAQEKFQPVNPNEMPKYPWGLSLRLSQDELDKLNVDHGDWEVGDIFHLHALGRITSISSNETEGGEKCNVEIQITHLAGESEDAENEEEEPEHEEEPARKKRNMYF